MSRSDEFNAGYQGQHSPTAGWGAPLHDMTSNGTYPEDFYSHNGPRYYGGHSDIGEFSVRQIQGYRGKPEELVRVYRAMPKNVEAAINPGDWVTISKRYAHEHGEAALGGDYKVISRSFPAKHVYNQGDAPEEFGYFPH